MRILAAPVVCALALAIVLPAAPGTPEVAKAKEELARVEALVREGGLPAKRLDAAREAVREAEDQAVLRRTLYGTLQVQDLTGELTAGMMTSARRLVEWQRARVDAARQLVDAGVTPRTALTPLLEELDARRRTLHLAESRERLFTELTEMARAEVQRQAQMESERQSEEEASGEGMLSAARLNQLERDYARTFGHSLPVSARGDTTFHRALGFDHTGRIDVGLNPDSVEGRWLRFWLDRSNVPHLVFRSAIRGVSSAPHVHIGPPSNRLRAAD